jgi:hypothetical protein
MFDESYNVKVTDFGACVCVLVSDVLEQPRAMTGKLLWGVLLRIPRGPALR